VARPIWGQTLNVPLIVGSPSLIPVTRQPPSNTTAILNSPSASMKSNAKLTAPTLRKHGSLDTRQKRETLSLCSLHPLHDSVASHISSQQADMMFMGPTRPMVVAEKPKNLEVLLKTGRALVCSP